MKTLLRYSLLSLTLISSYSFATDFIYCPDDSGGVDGAPFNSASPNAWICALKTALKTSTPDKNGVRCTNSTKSFCSQAGAGDMSKPGPHDVPNRAWYAQGAYDDNDGMMRCQCGCFIGDVELLTTRGNLRFEDAAKTATEKPFRVAIPRTDGKLFASEVMANKTFTVGPEEKDILKFTTDMGLEIDLTDSHPVLVSTEDGYDMVQSRLIKVGDKLLTKEGIETSVQLIKAYKLPADNNKVYNIDTLGKTIDEHIIVANSLQMGDVKWQNHLSEISQREQMLKKSINSEKTL